MKTFKIIRRLLYFDTSKLSSLTLLRKISIWGYLRRQTIFSCILHKNWGYGSNEEIILFRLPGTNTARVV